MLFYLLSTIGFLMLSSTIVIVGSCYYFLIQSMLQKSKGAAGNLISLQQKPLNPIPSAVNQ